MNPVEQAHVCVVGAQCYYVYSDDKCWNTIIPSTSCMCSACNCIHNFCICMEIGEIKMDVSVYEIDWFGYLY